MPKGRKVSFHCSLMKGGNVVPVPGQKSVDKIKFMGEKRY